MDASEAPYFVDLVHDQLTQKLGDRDFNREGLRIYTSLDPDLQQLATSAVDSTIHVVDEEVDRLHGRDRKLGKPYVYPQVALVASIRIPARCLPWSAGAAMAPRS